MRTPLIQCFIFTGNFLQTVKAASGAETSPIIYLQTSCCSWISAGYQIEFQYEFVQRICSEFIWQTFNNGVRLFDYTDYKPEVTMQFETIHRLHFSKEELHWNCSTYTNFGEAPQGHVSLQSAEDMLQMIRYWTLDVTVILKKNISSKMVVDIGNWQSLTTPNLFITTTP